MKMDFENMTAYEITLTEMGITSQVEYDAYIDHEYEEYEKSLKAHYTPTDEEIDLMYQDYLASEYMDRLSAIDYGKYDFV